MTLSKYDGTYYLMQGNKTIMFDSFVNNRGSANSVALMQGDNVIAILYFDDSKEFFKAWRAMQ